MLMTVKNYASKTMQDINGYVTDQTVRDIMSALGVSDTRTLIDRKSMLAVDVMALLDVEFHMENYMLSPDATRAQDKIRNAVSSVMWHWQETGQVAVADTPEGREDVRERTVKAVTEYARVRAGKNLKGD